jgi:hypothetical protein
MTVAHDPGLAERLREMLAEEEGIAEQAMSGALSFTCGGRTFIGIVRTLPPR